jgi:hypothetical protein
MRWGRVVVVGFAVSAMSCLAPTEIMLVLSTDFACSVVSQNSIAIAVGDPGDDDSGIATTTKLCADDGGVGTIAILPHASVDQPIGIRVTLGVDAAADNCGPNFQGCIVARRSLRFDPHAQLTLPIDLDQACIGVPCTPNSTCVSGSCVDAGVECDDASCAVPPVDAGPPVDAAGTCQTITDFPVQLNAGAGTPRITLSSDGWAVAYLTAQLGIELVDVTVTNGSPSKSTPVPLVLPNSASLVGPLGSDTNAGSYAFTYENTTSSSVQEIVAPDGTSQGAPLVHSNYRAANFGMISYAPKSFGTAFIVAPGGDPQLVTFDADGGIFATSGNLPSNLVDITLVRSTTGYYATSADLNGVCTIYECTLSTSFDFLCGQVVTPLPKACQAVRIADGLGKTIHVVEGNNMLTVDDKFPLNAAVVGAQFQIVATHDAFQIVYASTGSIGVATYDGNATPKNTPYPFPGETVLGMDVVADGPNQPGYAIAYTVTGSTGTSVRFMHLCQ